VRTAEHAAQRGAAAISLIPVRGGNGELERLAAQGHFAPPPLRQLETALDRCIALGGERAAVAADLWDVDRLPACAECGSGRVERLRRMNLTGRSEPPVSCSDCD
jgi:archaeosine synthase beta-subunit